MAGLFFFRYILRNVQDWTLFIIALLFSVASACFEGLSFGFILLALDLLGGGSEKTEYGMQFLGKIQEYLYSIVRVDGIILFLSLAILAQIFRSCVGYIGVVIYIGLVARAQKHICKSAMEKIFLSSFFFAKSKKTGALAEIFQSSLTISGEILENLYAGLSSFLALLVLVVTMFYVAPSLTFLAMGLFCMVALAQRFLMKRITFLAKEYFGVIRSLQIKLVEVANNILAVHLFAKQEYLLTRLLYDLQQGVQNAKRIYMKKRGFLPVSEVLGIVSIIIFLLVGWECCLYYGITKSVLLTFVPLLYRASSRLNQGLAASMELSYFAEKARFLHVFLCEKDMCTVIGSVRGGVSIEEIQFCQVSFAYPGAKTVCLKNISISIPLYKTTGIVGPSGSGKSSILHLLTGLYAPTNGRILVGTQDLGSIDMLTWRQSLGVVSQEPCIFCMTIAENIRFGAPGASDQEVVAAAKLAGIDEFISSLPLGYETEIGRDQAVLSGGEQQRLALARALVKNPQILILDEPTSQLDGLSEEIIQDSLQKIQHHTTIVVVAHRLSTVWRADNIIVMQQGEMVGQGPHHVLLQENAVYADMWSAQIGER